MGVSRCNIVAAIAVGIGAALFPPSVVAQSAECSTSTDPTFSYEVTPQEGFVIYWSVDTTASTVAFKVDYTGLAWIGLGFSVDGLMVDSDAVIALPDAASVLEYNLAGQSPYAIEQYVDEELESFSVSQDTTTTTMTFTRPLAPADATKEIISSTPGDDTILIWSYGTDNDLNGHSDTGRGSITLDVFCMSADATSGATPAPTPGTTAAVPTAGVATEAPIQTPTPSPVAEPAPSTPSTTAPVMPTAASLTSAPSVGVTSAPEPQRTPSPTSSEGGLGGGPTDAPTSSPVTTVGPMTAPTSAPSGAPTPGPTVTSRAVPPSGGSDSPTTAPNSAPSSAPTSAPSSAAGDDDETVGSGTPTPTPSTGGQDTDGGFRIGGGRGLAWLAAVVTAVAGLLGAGVVVFA